MSRFAVATALSTAIGVAVALSAPIAHADPVADNTARAMAEHLSKCYGINAVAKNDCATGVHSCAGQATMAKDPKSFVLLPEGACSKIDGGSPTAL